MTEVDQGGDGVALEKKLRLAAMECSNMEYRMMLRGWADTLTYAVRRFNGAPTRENMRALTCLWAAAERALANVPPEAPPAPLAGAPEPARLAV